MISIDIDSPYLRIAWLLFCPPLSSFLSLLVAVLILLPPGLLPSFLLPSLHPTNSCCTREAKASSPPPLLLSVPCSSSSSLDSSVVSSFSQEIKKNFPSSSSSFPFCSFPCVCLLETILLLLPASSFLVHGLSSSPSLLLAGLHRLSFPSIFRC